VIDFTGVLLSIDGKQKLEVTKTVAVSEWKKLGFHAAQEVLANGGTAVMTEIKKELKK
jgi:hydroxymethylbilane synthase